MNKKSAHEMDGLLAEWRGNMHATSLWDGDGLLELESHLLDQMESLLSVGLSTDEAYGVATMRSVGRRDQAIERGVLEHLGQTLL